MWWLWLSTFFGDAPLVISSERISVFTMATIPVCVYMRVCCDANRKQHGKYWQCRLVFVNSWKISIFFSCVFSSSSSTLNLCLFCIVKSQCEPHSDVICYHTVTQTNKQEKITRKKVSKVSIRNTAVFGLMEWKPLSLFTRLRTCVCVCAYKNKKWL